MPEPSIHESAIVDDGAEIGDDSYVWHWTHISSQAKIGKNCSIGQNVFIANNVVIGNNVKIQNNVSLYDGVIIEDNVFCGPSCVFTNVINPRSSVNRKKQFKKTVVEKGATIGANATIVCGNTIKKYAFIAASAVVTKDVDAFSLMKGNPAKHCGWMSHAGKKLDLPLLGNAATECTESGMTYTLEDNFVRAKRIDS